MALEETIRYPINPFYAPEYPPIERLRCRVDYEVHMQEYEVAPQGWNGTGCWQFAPGDDERFGLTAQDMPRLFAVWRLFEAITGMGDHFISGDAQLIEGAFDAMPWLNPNVVSDSDFARFAELMGVDGQKARGYFLKVLSHGHDDADDEAFAARYDDPDIPF